MSLLPIIYWCVLSWLGVGYISWAERSQQERRGLPEATKFLIFQGIPRALFTGSMANTVVYGSGTVLSSLLFKLKNIQGDAVSSVIPEARYSSLFV